LRTKGPSYAAIARDLRCTPKYAQLLCITPVEIVSDKLRESFRLKREVVRLSELNAKTFKQIGQAQSAAKYYRESTLHAGPGHGARNLRTPAEPRFRSKLEVRMRAPLARTLFEMYRTSAHDTTLSFTDYQAQVLESCAAAFRCAKVTPAQRPFERPHHSPNQLFSGGACAGNRAVGAVRARPATSEWY
jgi:hypothetical protein